jgi:hypothetical protein
LWRNFRQRVGFNRPCRSAIKLKKGFGVLTDERKEAFEEMKGEKIPTDEYEDE